MPISEEDKVNPYFKSHIEKLDAFFRLNPIAGVGIDENDEEAKARSMVSIIAPWGDDSVAIVCDLADQAFIDMLNNLYLPERYSGMYHVKEKKFEVAWTAYPISERYGEILHRKFDFIHNGQLCKCSYGRSSAALIEIASRFYPHGAANSTDYRNLYSFSTYSEYYFSDGSAKDADADIPEYVRNGIPISFFIEIEKWDEDQVFDLANHINFYMTYYDTLSPTINIHSPQEENITKQPQKRMAYGDFPTSIIAKKLDDNLLHFWQAARTGDPARRFLYNYQIIEYSSFVVIEESISKAIRKLLSSPHLLSSTDLIMSQILEITSESKISDPQKIEGLFRRVVDPKLIWAEMQLNISKFQSKTEFDGGHSIPPLVKDKWVESDFVQIWPIQFATTLRNMRNTLSHGREQRMTAVITPTAENLRKLQAWVPLVEVAAREVMVYRHMAD